MAIASLTAPLLALLLSFGGFNWRYSGQAEPDGTVWVELESDEALDNVKVEITGSDGSSTSKKVSIKPGKPTRISWKQKDRQVSYDIEIEANESFTNGSFEIQKPITGGKHGPFELISDRAEIVDGQKIRYKTPFTATSIDLQVYDTDGDLITEKSHDGIVEAGDSFTLDWNTNAEVFMIKVTGSDDTGFSYTDTRVPWSVDIPHTEVNFDSGKAIIKPDEEPKVAEAFAVLVHELAGLDKANAAVNGNLSAQLYIVGYTDTVGNAADNQKLSEARAKAIAQYFYDKGAWCEIYYAGMGERGLAVETGDSVDEVRNRRALYILGVQKPAGGGQVPGPSAWKQLAPARTRMINKLPDLPESYVKYKEEQRKKREAKFAAKGGDSGSSSSGDGDGEGGSGGSDSEWGKGSLDEGDGGGSGGSSGGGSGDDGPSAVEGKPGGTAKGCTTTDATPAGAGLLGLFGLLALRRRRRAG